MSRRMFAIAAAGLLLTGCFSFLLIGALAWGSFVADASILAVLLERIWDPLDAIVFILIALSGLYWLVRVFMPARTRSGVGSR